MDKVQIYQELERRGELGKLPPEKQAIWAEYKRRQSPSAPAETPGQKAWNSFKEDIADLTYAPRKALSGATFGASDWALRKLGVGYDDTENRMGEVSPLAKGLTKVGGFGAELGGNIGGLGGGLVKALAGKGLKGLKLGMASGGIEGVATGATGSDTLSELPKNVGLGGLIGTGGGALGEGLTYFARPFSARSLTKGMKGGLNNVVENPEAVKLLNQGIKQSDDVASEFLLKSRPVARGINKDTANMVDSALTSRIDVPETIKEANARYGQYMDEHGADEVFDMSVKSGDMVKDNIDTIKNFHKTQNINFDKISADDFKNLKPKKIHQSPDNFGKKGSEYFVAEKDGKLYYIRKSDHWGKFSTNKKIGDFKAEYPDVWNKYKNLSSADAETKFIDDLVQNKGLKLDTNDIYGRLDNNIHNWELIGGKKQGATVNPKDFYLYEKHPSKYESLLSTGKLPDYYPTSRQIGMTEIPIPQSNLPHINTLYEGLTKFQSNRLDDAMKLGFSKTNAKRGSLESLNKVKQEINEQIKKAMSTEKPSEVWQLEELKHKFDKAMPEGLKAVDKGYERAKRLENAFERGTHYNPNNVEGADYISELSPLEQNAFAQGLFKRINNNSLTGKNLANTALGYENTLASVLKGDKYDDLMKGLNKQSTKFERLAGLGRKAESKLNTPEAQRLFAREQLESKGSRLGTAIDWANSTLRRGALERAGKNLLNPNYVGDSEAWLIENYPIIAGYLSSKLNQEVNQ